MHSCSHRITSPISTLSDPLSQCPTWNIVSYKSHRALTALGKRLSNFSAHQNQPVGLLKHGLQRPISKISESVDWMLNKFLGDSEDKRIPSFWAVCFTLGLPKHHSNDDSSDLAKTATTEHLLFSWP